MKIQNEYIPVSKKREIANKVVMMSSENMNGLIKIDSFKKRIYTFMFAAEEYLGENFGDDFDILMNKYDELVEDCTVWTIKDFSDYAEFERIVDDLVYDTEKVNSIEHSISQMCGAIISAVGKISDSLADKISEFDTDILKDADITELMSVINGLK
jgi:hypothetical protein